MRIKAEGITAHYQRNPVLWDVSFTIPSGVLCGIAGPNGAGKSTLLKVAMGLVLAEGAILFDGLPLSEVRKKIAYIPQKESIAWDFPITAFDLVLMGRYSRFGLFGRPRQADREAAARALEQVEMTSYAHRQISELSGGQQQRLFLARALVQEPDVFLLDEPFSGVDLSTEQLVMDLLRSLKKEGKTILIVFHDLSYARQYFDWILLLNRRLIASGPVEQTFTEDLVAKTFGKVQHLFDEATTLSARAGREGG